MGPIRHVLILLGAAGLIAGAAAGSACAAQTEDAYVTKGDFAFQSNNVAPETRRRTLEWDAKKGRWGLKLDVEQHDPAHGVEAISPGVFFKVTPRLHIGGGLSLHEGQADTPLPAPAQANPPPRVRLETTFKF